MNLGCQIMQKPFTLQEIINWPEAWETTIGPKRIFSSCFQEQAQALWERIHDHLFHSSGGFANPKSRGEW